MKNKLAIVLGIVVLALFGGAAWYHVTYNHTTTDFDSLVYEDGVITNITAEGGGPGSDFEGSVTSQADLDELLKSAWGNGALDLHRGHGGIENVLEAFLGINHERMHWHMEVHGRNLADTAIALEKDPEDLIDTLTESHMPFLEYAVQNGVITQEEMPEWRAKVREQFSNRVYWDGQGE